MNKIKHIPCNTILESKTVNDIQKCPCGVTLQGGPDYQMISDFGDAEQVLIYYEDTSPKTLLSSWEEVIEPTNYAEFPWDGEAS